MPIDARIREGLAMIDKELPQVDTLERYDDLERDIRRNNRRRWTFVGAAAAAVVAALVVSAVALNRGSEAGPEPVHQPKLPSDVMFYDAEGQISYVVDGVTHTLGVKNVDRFAVSPDGRQIAYTTDDGSGTRQLWMADLDGSNARELPAACNGCQPGYGVTWSNDGTRLAYVEWTRGERRVQLRIRTLSTGEEQVRKIPAGLEARGPRFSPDDQQLAVTIASDSGQYVARVLADGSGVLTGLSSMFSQVQAPSWSEDGRSVFFTATTSGDDTHDVNAAIDVYSAAVDASGAHPVTSAHVGERYFAATQFGEHFLVSKAVGDGPWYVGWLTADGDKFEPMKGPDGKPLVGNGAVLLP